MGNDNETSIAYADYPLNEGTAVILSDAEVRDEDCLVCMDDPQVRDDTLNYKDHTCGISIWRLDYEAIQRGVQLLARKYPARLAEILEAVPDDAVTADVFIQLCVFGEIVYG